MRLAVFDVKTYEVPSIEDIELGYRIANAGYRILVEPMLQGKHLKVWTMRNSLSTDIYCRALPWARLMISREGLTDDLNTSMAERARAAIAGLLLLSVLALPFWPATWPLPLLLLAVAVFANFDLVRTLGGAWWGMVCLKMPIVPPSLLRLFGHHLCLVPVRISRSGAKAETPCHPELNPQVIQRGCRIF